MTTTPHLPNTSTPRERPVYALVWRDGTIDVKKYETALLRERIRQILEAR